MSGLEPVIIESSIFERQRVKCLQAGILFEDPDFPATIKSIYFTRRYNYFQTNSYKWMRPKELCKYYYTEPYFYLDGGSRFDLIQGELGDCWVVAAAACLSEDRHLLERVIPPGQSFSPNWYAGIFRFRFWQYGEWVEVVIDDRLPTIGGKLVFVHSNHENEFWGALLEKAYAKLHGSYESLRAGTNSDALTDFTGGLVEQYFMSEPPPNLSRLFYKAFERRSLIGAAIYGDYSDNVELASGLVTGHAYSVTAMKEVNVGGRTVHLVRVRNPWGSHVEWRGAWSDNSEEWKLLSNDDRSRLGIVKRDDGEFWMDFRDFVRHFHAVEICNLTADALVDPPKTWTTSIIHSQWVRDHSAGGRLRYDTFWKNPQIRLRVVDHDEDEDDMASFVIELLQKDRRSSKQSGLDNLTIGFVIYSVLPNTPMPLTRNYFYYNQPIGQVNSYVNSRSVVQRFSLKPGDYVIVPTTWSPNEEAEFTVRVFSEAKHSTNKLSDPEDNTIPNSNNNNGINSHGDATTQSLRKYFDSLAGPDKETDGLELKKCLDYALAYENFGHLQFKYSTCKYLIIMMDADSSGKLEFSEFLNLWSTLKQWLQSFVSLDKDRNGMISVNDMDRALQMLGYNLDPKLIKSLVYRYSDSNSRLSFNKYIYCIAKVRMLFNRFRAGPLTEGTLSLSFPQWLRAGFLL